MTVTIRLLAAIDDEECKGLMVNLELKGDGSPEHWREATTLAQKICAVRVTDTFKCPENKDLKWNGTHGIGLFHGQAGAFVTQWSKFGDPSRERQSLEMPPKRAPSAQR